MELSRDERLILGAYRKMKAMSPEDDYYVILSRRQLETLQHAAMEERQAMRQRLQHEAAQAYGAGHRRLAEVLTRLAGEIQPGTSVGAEMNF